MLEKGSVRVSDLVSRGSCVEVETFLRDGHPDAWWTLGLPRRQFLFLFAGTEELDFACFFLSHFKYRAGGFQRFWLLLFGYAFIFLSSFSALSSLMSVEVKNSGRSSRTSYFGDGMGCSGNRRNEVNATFPWLPSTVENGG